MQQFYLLSIATMSLLGLSLLSQWGASRSSFLGTLESLIGGRSKQRMLGVLTAVVGIFKLFIYGAPAQVPVIGDLAPALIGLGAGALVTLSTMGGSDEPSTDDRVSVVVDAYRLPLSIITLTVAGAHFLFPATVLL